MGHVLKINPYEIVDAEMDVDNLQTVRIPCQTNPGLVRQLDGWDSETSISAQIDGNQIELALDHYDKEHDCWVLKKAV